MNILYKMAVWLLLFFSNMVYGAYLTNIPTTITQPNGQKIQCLASGDEFHNWLHDKNGYTIIQNPQTGYYTYASMSKAKVASSNYVVGEVDPKSTGLPPYINISAAERQEKRARFLANTPEKPVVSKASGSSFNKSSGDLNNLVVYIRFANQTEFPANQTTYTSMFNSTSSGTNSMRNFFREATYSSIDMSSTFYPSSTGSTIVSYRDSHNREYFMPYSVSNTSGYQNETERRNREHNLLQDAIQSVESQIPSSLDLDFDNDNYVDNVCFIVRGGTTAWNTLLWPHRWALYSVSEYIHGKRVYDYNFQLETHLASSGVGVLCHEMYHTLGAPDLYHYNGDNMDPVGDWDLMEHSRNPPQHMGAYMKYEYGDWITSIPEITTSGTYTLNPITSSSNNCYKIPIRNSSEYLVLEYRRKTGTFESTVPNSGLLVYRINESKHGNSGAVGAGGAQDEVYVFRPNGTLSAKGDIANANFSSNVGRTTFHTSSNPRCFTSDGSVGDVHIKNITSSGSTISFDVRFCDGTSTTYSSISSLPTLVNMSGNITTTGAVIVESSDNVTFESGGQVTLGTGFEIQTGGLFTVNMNGCANR